MILTTIRSMNARQPSWRIVREWDEIIASNLNLNLVSENRLSRFLKFRVINKYGLAQFYNTFKFKRKKIALCFIMTAETNMFWPYLCDGIIFRERNGNGRTEATHSD